MWDLDSCEDESVCIKVNIHQKRKDNKDMKILVLNGSPKKDASDTMHITRAFLDGMNDISVNAIHTINVIEQDIKFCTGCFSCMRNGGDCIHNDDMKDILDKILDADILLLSFPLYCYGMPAHLKALIDRTLPLGSMEMKKVGDHYEHVAQKDYSKLRYVMICGCGFPNSENNFEPAVMQFKRMFGSDSTVITVSESPMFNAPEAEKVTKPFLEVVRESGREYAKDGVIADDTMKKLNTPMIAHDIYAEIVNGGVK